MLFFYHVYSVFICAYTTYLSHISHVENGTIGSLQRDGQSKVSTACGAAIGAYKELQKTKKTAEDPLLVLNLENEREYDPQLKNIVSLLAPRLNGIDESADSIAFVTYQMYGIIRELITSEITSTPELFDLANEVAVVGGIMINRRKGGESFFKVMYNSYLMSFSLTLFLNIIQIGDFFQPISFETRRKDEAPVDLFEDAFGNRPNLLPIIGSQEALTRASLY